METALIPLNVGLPTKRSHKMTVKRRKQFLETFAQTANLTKACDNVKIARKTIYDLIQRDPAFASAFHEINERITDHIEEVSINVAIQPSRDSFNDRKLQLMARNPSKYNPKTIIDLDITLKVDPNNAGSNLRNLLSSNAITADYEVID